jgi:hypothetical protein
VGGAAVGAFSVPRYHPLIVAAYLLLLAVLAATTWRASSPHHSPFPPPLTDSLTAHRWGGAIALWAAGLAVWTVGSFTYLSAPQASALRLIIALAAATGGLAITVARRRGPDLALALAALAYAATTAATIRLDPAPRIDVWYTLQGAADGLAHGENLYRQVLVGPPGRMAAFTYLPGTAVLLAPGRWLAGDVRWTLALVTLCTSAAFVTLGNLSGGHTRGTPVGVTVRDEWQGASRIAGALLLLLPGTLTQVEQAWTEPLLLGCLTAASGAHDRRNTLAVLGVASPWRASSTSSCYCRFSPLGHDSGHAALWPLPLPGMFMLPWFVADPAAMWHDTVSLLVNFPPRFADTVYIAVLNEFDLQLPVWLTGTTVLATIIVAAIVVRRRDPSVAVVLRWAALVLFVANLMNKQAFYNQYWLVAGLILASWAITPSARGNSTAQATLKGHHP